MGTFWGSLGNGYYQGLDQARQRQIAQMQLQQMQDMQAGQGALANQYAQYLPPPPTQQPPQQQQQPPQGGPPPQGGQPPQGAMPPPPGQQSQPQRPPQGAPPGGGMPPPPQGGMPPPPQQAQPQQRPQQLPPYTAPQAPQPQQQPMGGQPPQQGQQGIPPPPGNDPVSKAVQSTLPDVHEMAAKLQAQGITGMPLFYALQQHQQFLSQDGKQQLAQLTLELRAQMAQVQNDIRKQQVGVNQEKADTSRIDATRRQDTASGSNAVGAAKIDLMDAQAKAALARVHKASAAGGTAGPSDDDEGIAKAVASNRLSPSLLSNKGGYRERIIKQAIKINPDYDAKEYNAENAGGTAGARAAGTASAKSAVAGSAAMGGADILEDAAEKVPRTQWRQINRALAAARGEAGVPEQGAFDTALNTFVNEYAKAVNPNGVATVSDKVHARELLSTADSPESFKAKMAVMRKEMTRAVQAPRDVAKQLKADRTGTSQKSYATAKDAETAAKKGEIKVGDTIMIGGKAHKVEP